MDGAQVRALLAAVAAGRTDVDAAARQLVDGYADLGFARVDVHRSLRTGEPEVVYAAGKTPEQTVAIVEALVPTTTAPVLVTRAGDATATALLERWPDAEADPVARCVAVGTRPEPRGTVAVVSAGTSDAPVTAEVAFVARTYGAGVDTVQDVGVAGLHRVLAVRDRLQAADCVVVVAGMDGALPSAVGGLVGGPVVAVPTSVGYGASFGGLSALLAMLNSCAPGVVVSNIDNGFGAGVFAARVARRAAPRP